MKTRVLSVLLVLVLTATMLVSFGTVASAEDGKTPLEIVGVGWDGRSVKWLKSDHAKNYHLVVIRVSTMYETMEIMSDYMVQSDGSVPYFGDGVHPDGSYDAASGVYTADFSKHRFYDQDGYFYIISAYPADNNKEYTASGSVRGETVGGDELNQGYREPLKKSMEGSAYIDTGNRSAAEGVTLTAVYEVAGATPADLKLTWQSRKGESGEWEDMGNASGKTYTVAAGDLGKSIRIKVEDTRYYSFITSAPVYVQKKNNYNYPIKPELSYSPWAEWLSINNVQSDQEYVISDRLLTQTELDEKWKNAISRGSGTGDLTFQRNQLKADALNYVYTRIKETEEYKPSDAIAMSAAYCGEKTLELVCCYYDPSGREEDSFDVAQRNGVDSSYEGSILRLTVVPTVEDPSFAGILAGYFNGSYKSEDFYFPTFYEDKACTKKLDFGAKYKDVYTKLEKTGKYVFTVTDDNKEIGQLTLHVGYIDHAGTVRVILENLSIPDVTIIQGTKEYELPIDSEPEMADIIGGLVHFTPTNTDGRTAPEVSVTPDRRLKVDAAKADLGEYTYDVTYVDRDYEEQPMTTCKVTVVESNAPAEKIVLSPDKLILSPGESATLSAIISPVSAKTTVSWKSDHPDVVRVKDGQLIVPATAKEGDTAIVTATTDNGLNATSEVFVMGTAVTNPFVDVLEGSYYYNAVLWAYYANPQVTNGVDETHFAPDSTVTRGQTVTFLWRAMGQPEPATVVNPFADIGTSDYYYKAVLWAVEEGITKGTDDNHFSPDQTCSTAHIITFLYRTLGEGTDGWYQEAGSWAKSKDLLKDTGKEVSPEVNCPRCDVVTFLYRTVKE